MVIIGIAFILVNFLLIPLLPTSTKPKTKSLITRQNIDTNHKEFLSQFLHHPLPYHTIKNITKYGIKRLVAIGDLHGDLSAAINILSKTKCIDAKTLKWIARNTVLVQTGDIVDRGEQSIEIYRLFLRLRKEAIEDNSLIINLLGNHEALDMMDEFHYVNPKEMQKYGETKWKKLWSVENDEIGYWLRNAPVVVIIGNTLFCHAGLRSIALKEFDENMEKINEYARMWLIEKNKFEMLSNEKQTMITGMNGPFWTRAFEPKMYLVESGLVDEIEQEYGKKYIDFAVNNAEEREKSLMSLVEVYMCKHLKETFEILNVSRMVKGHDPQQNGKVGVYCDDSLFLIDVGLSKAYGANVGAILVDLTTDSVTVVD